jgi:DNA-binding MarR family transcriptional regulator
MGLGAQVPSGPAGPRMANLSKNEVICLESNNSGKDLLPCYCANIRWISREVTKFYMRYLGKADLQTIPFYTVLSVLNDGSSSMADLSETVHLERTTLVRKLKLMQQEGLISFSDMGVPPMKLVHITEKGKGILEEANDYWNQAQADFRSVLSNSEMETLESILKKLSFLNSEK